MATNKPIDRENRQLPLLAHNHLLVGWWSLLCFLSLGIVLEGLHGFKVTWYLGVNTEIRRLMWTLAHSHGTLISLIHLAFAFSLLQIQTASTKLLTIASQSLLGAGILIPVGFFLGGMFCYTGDPGLGILLVPPGAILLFVSVFLVAIQFTRKP
jgi:hypothetical protein